MKRTKSQLLDAVNRNVSGSIAMREIRGILTDIIEAVFPGDSAPAEVSAEGSSAASAVESQTPATENPASEAAPSVVVGDPVVAAAGVKSPAAAPALPPEPAPEPMPVPAPEPAPAPVPEPASQPELAPAPVPEPTPLPAPDAAALAALDPAPAPVAEPVPTSEPAPAP